MINDPTDSAPRWRWAILALILLLAIGLRVYRLDAQSFWNDEGNSARIAERSIPLILEGAAGDIHPPGYYLLLAGWRALFGQSEIALRALSVTLSTLTVALSYSLAASLFGWKEALIAAALVAVNPFQVYYAQEARMYALLATLGTASFGLTVGLLTESHRKRRLSVAIAAGYTLVNAAGMYTHYSFPFIILAETITFLLWWIGRRSHWRDLAIWIGLQLGTLALFAPWLPTALRQMTGWPTAEASFAVGDTLLRFAVTLAYGVTLPPQKATFALVPLGMVVAVGLFPPIEDDQHPLRFYERVAIPLTWLAVPVGLALALGLTRDAYLKFLLPSSVAVALLVGRGVVMGLSLGRPLPATSTLTAWLTRAMVLILAIVGLFPTLSALHNLYFNPTYARDDYRSIAAQIEAENRPNAAIVLNAPNQWEVFTYYYPDPSRVYPLPDSDTEATVGALLREHRWIYALYWGDTERDPTRSVERALNAGAFVLSSEWIGGVRVVRYFVEQDSLAPTPDVLEAYFGDHIMLVDAALTADTLQPDDPLGVLLTWQTDAPLDTRYKVFVHLYAPDGTLLSQHDGEPNGGLMPTTEWSPGESVADRHGLVLPANTPPRSYRLAIGLYEETGSRLPVAVNGEPAGDTLSLVDIQVED